MRLKKEDGNSLDQTKAARDANNRFRLRQDFRLITSERRRDDGILLGTPFLGLGRIVLFVILDEDFGNALTEIFHVLFGKTRIRLWFRALGAEYRSKDNVWDERHFPSVVVLLFFLLLVLRNVLVGIDLAGIVRILEDGLALFGVDLHGEEAIEAVR